MVPNNCKLTKTCYYYYWTINVTMVVLIVFTNSASISAHGTSTTTTQFDDNHNSSEINKFDFDENENEMSAVDSNSNRIGENRRVILRDGIEILRNKLLADKRKEYGPMILSDFSQDLSSVKIIPNGHYVSDYLHGGVLKRLIFVIEDNIGSPLDIILTPCTSVLMWSIKFFDVLKFNQKKLTQNLTLDDKEILETLRTFRSQRTIVFSDKSSRLGLYIIDINSLYGDSYFRIFASNSPDPSITLLNSINLSRTSPLQYTYIYYENYGLNLQDTVNNLTKRSHHDYRSRVPRPKIWTRRLQNGQILIKWDHLYNNINYCIVINTRKDYNSLCSAIGDKNGVLPPSLSHASYYNYLDSSIFTRKKKNLRDLIDDHDDNDGIQNLKKFEGTDTEMMMGCLGSVNHYKLNNVQNGKMYYFNVFANEIGNNLSWPYARTSISYKNEKKYSNRLMLEESKPIKIKILGEKSTLVRFKLNRPCRELTIYTIPCGGGKIHFQLIYSNSFSNESKILFESENTETLEIIKMSMPRRGKYLIRFLKSKSKQTLDRTARMVEIFVSKRNGRFPLPRLPSNIKVWEDLKLKRCDSVVINWMPSPEQKDNEYCIFLKEDEGKKELRFKTIPSQCDVEKQLKHDAFVKFSFCLQRNMENIYTPLSQEISGLSPSKMYIVQVIVRRYKAKSLSYELTTVSTLDTCNNIK